MQNHEENKQDKKLSTLLPNSVDICPVFCQPLNIESELLRNNMQLLMNQKLINQVVTEFKCERDNDLQLVESLRRVGTPSASKTIEEIETKNRLVESILKASEEYMALMGIPLEGVPESKESAIMEDPKSLRNSKLKGLILKYSVGTKFDIAAVRHLAFGTYPRFFGTEAEFYGVYWKAVKELQEQGALNVFEAGKGRRPTTFERIETPHTNN